MATWSEYRKTIEGEKPVFSMTKEGNLVGLISHLWEVSYIDETDHKGNTLLMLAAYHGHINLVRFLINQDANVNFVDRNGNTILMGAAFKGFTEVVEALLHAGADPFVTNPKGLTAKDFADMFGRSECSKLLGHNNLPEHNSPFGAWMKLFTPQWMRH